MSWKYPNNKTHIKEYRKQVSYVPFTFRDETHHSPFYRFQNEYRISVPSIQPLEFQGDEIFKQEKYRLQQVADANNLPISHRSGKSLSSDSEEELRSEELLEMQQRVTKKGRRKAAIFQSFQFGLQLEDIFHNNLSSLAKNINEEQRSPGKTSFDFNNMRSGLLDEMDQVKGMIESHRNSKNVLKSNDNLENENTQEKETNENNKKEKKNKKQLSLSKQNKSSQSQTQQELLDLSIQGVSPKKINEKLQEEIKLFSSKQEEKNNEQENNENLHQDNLNDYLNQTITHRGVNKKKGLRPIFIMYKKYKGSFYSIQIEKFFIPVYIHITDNLELIQDFLYWKDYLSKWMKMRGKVIENIFTSNGFRIMNLNQVKNSENILIIQDEDGQLEFWHDFQIYHNIQLTTNEQRVFADYVNNLQTREEIYKSFISQSILTKVLQAHQAEKTPNQTMINTTTQKNTQSKGFLPNINQKGTVNHDPINESSLIDLRSQSKRKGSDSSTMKMHSVSQKQFEPKLIQIQKERLELVDLYSQYQNIMISSLSRKLKHPNKVSSISQGALLKQFNGVKMKVLQQSFPYLAQKQSVEAKLQNSSYKSPNFSDFNAFQVAI